MFFVRLQVVIDFGNFVGVLIFFWGFMVEFVFESIFLYYWFSKFGIQDFYNFKILDFD